MKSIDCLCAAVASLFVLIASLNSASASILAVVVGIDHYDNNPSLKGAVHDAEDVASALAGIGAQVHLITDNTPDNPTRQNIMSAWNAAVAASHPGDMIVLTFAGHGMQEPELIPGSEEDHKDEVVVLPRFSFKPPGNGERIRDNDFHKLFAEVPKDRQILFLVDACHSGTMYRLPLALRVVRYEPIVDDALPPPASDSPSDEDLPNLIAIGASADDEVVPEFPIGGQPRGALSWAFSQGLRGAADANHDGVISLDELLSYLHQTVKQVAQELQHPKFAVEGDRNRSLFPLRLPSASTRPLMPISIRVDGETGGPASAVLTGFTDPPLNFAHAGETPDLVWRPGDQTLATSLGRTLASEITPDRLVPVLRKWLLVKNLTQLGASDPLSLTVKPNENCHSINTKVSFEISNRHQPHLVIFALAANGIVDLIFPRKDHAETTLGSPEAFALQSTIAPPAGADHVIALSFENAPGALLKSLEEGDGGFISPAIEREISDAMGQRTQIGVVGVYASQDNSGHEICQAFE